MTVVSVENLSKTYRLGQIGTGTLADDLRVWWAKTRGKPNPFLKIGQRDHGNRDGETIWALKDMSFTVNQGEVLGIIGRNGAGKSTLLKILTGITSPTSGQIKAKGRVASLLEVGTGFQPDLTGRENIYLNGAILGMKKAEIDRKFDEIVAFSEVEQFIDTPVKRYSSGMYVRLAFAVAAHLDPEILLVDEVLAVGDAAFQKKCLGKMGDVAGEGRTVLFVSHNMQAIRILCPRSILLDAGQIVSNAETERTLRLYNERQREVRVRADTAVHNETNRRGSGVARFTHIAVYDGCGNESFDVEMGGRIRFALSYRVMRDIPELLVQMALRSGLTGDIVTTTKHVISSRPVLSATEGSITIELPDVQIRPGTYPLYLWLGDSLGRPFDVVDDLTAPLIVSAGRTQQTLDFDPSSSVGYFSMPSIFTNSPGASGGE